MSTRDFAIAAFVVSLITYLFLLALIWTGAIWGWHFHINGQDYVIYVGPK